MKRLHLLPADVILAITEFLSFDAVVLTMVSCRSLHSVIRTVVQSVGFNTSWHETTDERLLADLNARNLLNGNASALTTLDLSQCGLLSGDGLKAVQLRCPNIRMLSLQSIQLSESMLRALMSFRALVALELRGSAYSGAKLPPFQSAGALRSLSLANSRCLSVYFRYSVFTALRSIDLSGCNIPGRILRQLASCMRLRELRIDGAIISRKAFRRLRQLVGLEALSMVDCTVFLRHSNTHELVHQMNDVLFGSACEVMRDVLQTLGRLRSLDLSRCHFVDDTFMSLLTSLPNLQRNLTHLALRGLSGSVPRAGQSSITADGWVLLRLLPNLDSLVLAENHTVTNAVVCAIIPDLRLRSLDLSHTDIGDIAFNALFSVCGDSLRHVSINCCRHVTADALALLLHQSSSLPHASAKIGAAAASAPAWFALRSFHFRGVHTPISEVVCHVLRQAAVRVHYDPPPCDHAASLPALSFSNGRMSETTPAVAIPLLRDDAKSLKPVTATRCNACDSLVLGDALSLADHTLVVCPGRLIRCPNYTDGCDAVVAARMVGLVQVAPVVVILISVGVSQLATHLRQCAAYRVYCVLCGGFVARAALPSHFADRHLYRSHRLRINGLDQKARDLDVKERLTLALPAQLQPASVERTSMRFVASLSEHAHLMHCRLCDFRYVSTSLPPPAGFVSLPHSSLPHASQQSAVPTLRAPPPLPPQFAARIMQHMNVHECTKRADRFCYAAELTKVARGRAPFAHVRLRRVER